MKDYIMSVIAAAILSGVASLLSPDKWKKYTGIISGMVILCTVAAPVSKIAPEDLFSSFEVSDINTELSEGEEYRNELIEKDLTKRIEADIEERLRRDFGTEAQVHVRIGVNEEGQITGVSEIKTDVRLGERAVSELCEVYGVEEISTAEDNEFSQRQE